MTELVLGLPGAAGHLALESNTRFIGNLYVVLVISPVSCWLKYCAVGACMLLVLLGELPGRQAGNDIFPNFK